MVEIWENRLTDFLLQRGPRPLQMQHLTWMHIYEVHGKVKFPLLLLVSILFYMKILNGSATVAYYSCDHREEDTQGFHCDQNFIVYRKAAKISVAGIRVSCPYVNLMIFQ